MRLLLSALLCLPPVLLVPTASADETKLALLPAESTLTGRHAIQQLVVESMAEARFTGDRTATAKFSSSDEKVATVDGAGLVRPVSNGQATITATVDSQSATSKI